MTRSSTSFFLAALVAAPAAAQTPGWIQQFGSSNTEQAFAAAEDGSGGLFATLYTAEPFGAPPSDRDAAWLLRLDVQGEVLWTHSFDLDGGGLLKLAYDGNGGVFATSDAGAPNWIHRFDGSGQRLWSQSIGGFAADSVESIAADGAGGVYFGGRQQVVGGPFQGTFEAWFGRLDAAGQVLWTRKLGTGTFDSADAVVADASGHLFVGGVTYGSLGGSNPGSPPDAWLARYDSAGQLSWLRQMGSSNGEGNVHLAPDGAGGVFLGASTAGDIAAPNAGLGDVWFAHFDAAGNTLWTRQVGTPEGEWPMGAVADGSGGLVLAGITMGAFGGPALGDFDTWVAHYDGSGSELSKLQLGTPARDFVQALAPGAAGHVFLVGDTKGNLGKPNAGSTDAWMSRIDYGCTAATTYCSASATSLPGCQAAIQGIGSPSLSSPSLFTITSGNVPGGNFGLCFFGAHGPANQPIGSLGGLLCVAAPFLRSAPRASDGTSGACDGQYVFTLEDLIASSPGWSAGTSIHAAIWARDPANPDGYLLSDGVAFSVCP